MRLLPCCLFLTIALGPLAEAEPAAPQPGDADIEIDLDLTRQQATLMQDGEVVYTSPISSGRASHPTPIGEFEVIEKDINHHSNLYGKIMDGRGHIVKSSADSATPVPKGCHFEQAPMRFFLRFDGAAGTHAGILPGYPASHGCVRMPAEKAKLFYEIATLGTPVHVHGTPPYHAEAPERRSSSHESRETHDEAHEAHESHPSQTAPPASPAPAPVKRGLFHWF